MAEPPESAPATQPTAPAVDKLTLHPAAASQPSLRHKLLPDLIDQTPGNAVTLYLIARRFWPDQKTTNEVLQPENGRFDYLETPIDKFPHQYSERLLAAYSETLTYVDLGARRREAHWDTGWRERGFGGKSPFGYADDLRHAANLLSFRARFQIAQHDWAGAEYTLQTEFSLARHFGVEDLLIHAMIESGFADIALSGPVEEWVSRDNSPNLYWALTDLPRPFVELRPVPEWEQMSLPYWKPHIAQALRGELPPQRWPQVVRDMVGDLQESHPPYKRDPAAIEAEARRLTQSALPRAKEYLRSHDHPIAEIDAMSPEQAVGMYLVQEYQTVSEELWRVWTLPFWESQEQMLKTWRTLGPDKPPALENPLVQTNLLNFYNNRPRYEIPSTLRDRYQVARPDRLIALMRTIEALRDYAAHHDSHAPQRLDQITDLPLPVDPMTGKPFAYQLEGRTATLDAPAPVGRTAYSGWRFELTFAQ